MKGKKYNALLSIALCLGVSLISGCDSNSANRTNAGNTVDISDTASANTISTDTASTDTTSTGNKSIDTASADTISTDTASTDNTTSASDVIHPSDALQNETDSSVVEGSNKKEETSQSKSTSQNKEASQSKSTSSNKSASTNKEPSSKGEAASKNEGATLEDGTFAVNVTLGGGTGRASITSPTQIIVKDGKAYATIIWSSDSYDYMIVEGEKYLNESEEGNSSFTIPVAEFNKEIPVTADTTAMSVPHEIEYTLNFAWAG